MAKLRPYGPGKFNTILDSYVYAVSLEGGGCDDETGDAQSTGWFGMMRHGLTIFRDHDPTLETLTEDEADYLRACAGCILTEDSCGFVGVEYFDTEAELDAAWSEVCADIEAADDDTEDN